VTNRLYVIALSASAATGRALLAHKRIPHRVITLPPGLHGGLLRLAGFEGHTVPAAEIEGRRLQGTRAMSRALEELRPHPPLFPADPARRERVELAEWWGEEELQPVPRRIFRYCLIHDRELRRWMAANVVRVPVPGLAGELMRPLGRRMAARSGAARDAARTDLAALPGLLDHADELIAEGIIGGEERNAADLQVFASIRVLLEIGGLPEMVGARPCAAAARRVYPTWLGPIPRSPVLDELS
jgi:glutathione S-transferase